MSRQYTHAIQLRNFYQLSFPEFDVNVCMSSKNLIHSKIFTLTKYREVLLKYSLLIGTGWYRLQLGTGWSRLLQFGDPWCWFLQLGIIWFRLVLIGAGWCSLIHVGADWSRQPI